MNNAPFTADKELPRSSRSGSLATARYRERLARARDRRFGMSNVKEAMPLDLIPRFVTELSTFQFHISSFAPNPFPRSLTDFKPGRVLGICSLDRELVWTASVLKIFEAELSDFVALQKIVMDNWLVCNWDAAFATLDEIEKRFGQSIWLIGTRIALLQEEGGLERQKEYAFSIRNDTSAGFMAQYFAYHFSSRAEATVSAAKYYQTMEDQIANIGDSRFRTYVRSHLFPVSKTELQDISGLTGFEETSPVVDRYLTFLNVCQVACAAAAESSENGDALSAVRKALSSSHLSVRDYRLSNLMYVCGAAESNLDLLPEPRVMAIYDNYTIGSYLAAAQESRSLIQEAPSRVDLYEISVKAFARCATPPDDVLPENNTSRIREAISDILFRNSRYVESLEALEKLVLVSSGHAISAQLSAFLARERASAPSERPSKMELIASLNCPISNPWQHRSLRAIDPALPVQRDLFGDYKDSPSIRIQVTIDLASSDLSKALATLRSTEMPKDRLDFYMARALERGGSVNEAIQLYERWLSSAYLPLYFEAARRLAWNYLELNRYDTCIELIVDAYLRSPHSYVSFPLTQVLDAIERIGGHKFAESLALPIIYDAYSRHISTNRDGQRSDAYEDFLLYRRAQRPSDLRAVALATAKGEATGLDLAKLTYYLRNVCTPRVMDSSVAFDGTKDLLLERIAVCQLLSEIDPSNANIYGDEIRSITQQVVVSEGLRQIEQSRIYVDTESIRESLEKTLLESFKRYTALSASKPFDSSHGELLKKVVEIIGRQAEAEVLSLPKNERDNLFDAMFAEFRDQFVNSTVHGLAAYLSGRIRHGILPNHLRSPLELAKLATQKDSITNKYRPNEYWISQYPWLSDEEARGLADRLAQFTEEVDALIHMVNQNWVQVRRESNPDGAFDFNVLNARRRVLQMEILPTTTYDEFLDLMFGFFWEITERNLTRLRGKIDTELKPRINDSFDRLQQDLAVLLAGRHLPELDAAVAKARTDMQVMLDKVKDWFRLSKSAEKQDFDLATLIDIAVQSTNNCFRHSPLQPKIDIGCNGVLKGETLTSLVELLYLFLSNVVLRSGVDVNPCVSIFTELSEAHILKFLVENEVAFANENARIAASLRVDGARGAIGEEAARMLVAKEGGTGYAKVWKIVTHDLECPYTLDFGFTENETFRVALTIDATSFVR